MCFTVKSKTRWKFNIFPKTVYKFVLKIDDNYCESFYYQERYKLNKLKKVSFKKIELYKTPSAFYTNDYNNLFMDVYSIGLHYYTDRTECVAQSCIIGSPTRIPLMVKCIIPPFSLRKENNNHEGITNKIKIVSYETV